MSNDLRLAIRHLSAVLHRKCDVPGNIHDAHINLKPFRSLMSDERRYSTVTPCDGDGLGLGSRFWY